MGRAARPIAHLRAGHPGRGARQVVLPGGAGRPDRRAQPGPGPGRRAAPAPRLVRQRAGTDADQGERAIHPRHRREHPRGAHHRGRPRGDDPALLRHEGLGAQGGHHPPLSLRWARSPG